MRLDLRPARLDLLIRRDTDSRLVLRLKQNQTTAVNLTGCVIAVEIYDRGPVLILRKLAEIYDPLGGVCKVDLTRSEIAAITPRSYTWELELTDTLGDRRCLVSGNFLIQGEAK